MCICICEANATLQNQNTVCLLFYQQLIIEAYDPFCVGVMVHPAVCTIKSLSTGIEDGKSIQRFKLFQFS